MLNQTCTRLTDARGRGTYPGHDESSKIQRYHVRRALITEPLYGSVACNTALINKPQRKNSRRRTTGTTLRKYSTY